MTRHLVTADDFYRELSDLRQKFQNMEPELELTVRDPKMGVEGYVVVWNTGISADGPLHRCGKGGTRVTKDLRLEDIRRLARAMAEKNAAAGLPLGGAKSGMRADPSDLDYEKKYRRFVELCKPVLHEHGGIFGGFGYDVGCRPPHNAHWACDQLGSTRSFTGKPVEMGGTDYDHEGIAGLGVAVAGKTLLEENGVTVKGVPFAVQGAGAMGSAVIRYFSEYGGVLSCLSDLKYGGTWTFHQAPSTELLQTLIDQHVTDALVLLEKEAVKTSENCADALYAETGILFPCALEDVIHEDNADMIKAKYIAEGANNPTTEAAHRRLFKNGVRVVPDIIANVGGIISAFVELTSHITDEENAKSHGKVTEAKEMTVHKITENTRELVGLVNRLQVEPDHVGDYMAYRNIFFGVDG